MKARAWRWFSRARYFLQGKTKAKTMAVHNCALLRSWKIKVPKVMANEQAGYFIHDWQELHDRVRRRHVTRCRLRRCAPSFTLVRVSAHGVLRSRQAISLLRH